MKYEINRCIGSFQEQTNLAQIYGRVVHGTYTYQQYKKKSTDCTI